MSANFSERPLIRFLSCVKPYRRYVIGAALMGIGKFTLPLAFPLAFKYVVDVLITTHPKIDGINALIDRWSAALSHLLGMSATADGKLAALSIAILAIYAVQSVASYFRNYWAGVAGNRLIFGLQARLFAHLQKLSHSYFDRQPSGAIVSRVLNDVSKANELVSSALIDAWMDAVSLGLVVLALFAMNWRLALVAIAIAPIWVTFMRYFAPRIKAVSHQFQKSVEEITGEVHERVVGAATIKSFGREEDEALQFAERTEQLFNHSLEKVRLAAAQEMLIQLLTRSAPMVVVWVGALMIMHGTITLGTMLAFFTYLGFLYLPLERFAQLSVVVSASTAAIERIFEFLDLKSEIVDHPLSRPFKVRRGAIEFEQVSFGYPARDGRPSKEVLRGVDLRIPGGFKVALVGRSGAGKTTVANLIPRFYDVTGGRVLIDGRDVRHFTLKSLRESVSLVSQDVLMFGASIRDNLRYARPDATDDMLWQALELASLREFVEQMPDKLDTIIGERGYKVSGGQRQRLAIARAFLKDSKIVILDEATSAVDSQSENLIHEAMERLMVGRTVIMIAHRLRSAATADIIVALDAGRVAEVGKHADLLRRGGVYARLYNEQMRGLTMDGGASRKEELQMEA